MIAGSTTDGALVALTGLTGLVAALLVVTVFLCAYAVLLRARHARRDRVWIALRRRWERPVLAAIVDPSTVPDVQSLVPDEYRMHFVQFILDYSRRVRGEERVTLCTLAAPFLGEIAERIDHPTPGIRTRAVQTLGTLGLPAYAPQVLQGLRDPSPLVSMVAARALARAEFPQFAPEILKNLHRFHGWNRRFLASMLAAIGPGGTEALRRGLASEDTPVWLRSVYAEALRMQHDPVSGDLAAAALADGEDDDEEFQAALLRLLAEVGRSDHRAAVRPLCRAGTATLRANAVHALGAIGDGSDLPELVEAMDDPSPWVTLHAARGVREAGGRSILEEMVEVGHPHARLAAQVLSEEADS